MTALPVEPSWAEPPQAAASAAAIQDLVRGVAAELGGLPAIERGARRLTYGELESRSNRLARELLALGVGPGTTVALLANDPLVVAVGILGVLKAGAVFVPLDAGFPPQRLAAMSQTIDARCFVVEDDLRELAATLAGAAAHLVSSDGTGDGEAPAPVEGWDLDGPCSIFFTSGSTGRPKAILGRLKGIGHFARWEAELVGVSTGTRVSQLSSPSFDGFLKDLFVPLVAGGVCCAPDSRQVLLDAARLVDWIDIEEIEVLHCVPSVLRSILTQPLGADYFSQLRWVVVAGEVLYPADVRRFTAVFGDRVRLLNLYGPTETTITKLFHVVRPADATRTSVPIGRPMPGAAAMVLGPANQPCRPGMVGEIVLRTPYRSLGYYGDPEETRRVFVPNPFREGDDLVYRTGDFGRLLEDGNLEFLGRRDQQVKVRGVRVELAELESHLRQHPAVRDVAVVDRDDADGTKVLHAYVVANGTDSEDLRRFLAERVPEPMLPSAFVTLDALPRTLNGKIDRRALPSLEDARAAGRERRRRPRTPVEEIVAGVWAQVLKLEELGVDESFFALGGHSLLATQILSRLRSALGVDLPLRAFLEAPTVAGVAAAVERALRLGPAADAEPIPRLPREGGDLPLSFAQHRMWFLARLSPDSTALHIPLPLRARGPLDARALAASFAEMERRHEVLRTTYPATDGLPVQRVHPPGGPALAVVDLEALPADRRETVAERIAVAESQRPFALDTGPLMRVRLLRLEAEDHLLVCTLHHVVADGWSRGVMVEELSAHYRSFLSGTRRPLPELPIQYADFAAWQRATLAGEALDRELAYWRQRLAGAPPVLALPTDRPRPTTPTFRGGQERLRLSPELSAAVRGLARRSGVTLFITLLAAFYALLHRLSGESDLVVGSSVGGRQRTELEGLIGCFVNMVALRVGCAGDLRFADLLTRVRDVFLDAFAHQAVPFELVVEALEPERDLAVSPLFQVVFSLQNAPLEDLELPGLELILTPAPTTAAKYDLLLDTWEDGDAIGGTLEYGLDLFEAETARRTVAQLVRLLESATEDAGRCVSEVSLLSPAERTQLLGVPAARPAAATDDRSILDLLARPAECADAVAVECAGVTLSHRQLRGRSRRVAGHLRRAGVRRGDLVALCCEHSMDEVAGLLGVLEAGAAYVPLDPTDPPRRWHEAIADSGARVVLTQCRLARDLDDCGAEVACLDTRWPELERGELAELPRPTADDVAYVIYTSGSTGRPKGVAVSHRALVRYLTWAESVYLRGDRPALPLYSSLAFDLTVTTLFLALTTGARLIVYPQRDGESALDRVLADDRVGVLKLTPAHLSMVRGRDLAASRVRRLVVGGEPLPARLAGEIARGFGDGVEIYNEYGPTEATVGCILHRFDGDESRASVPIGRVAAHARSYLLDRRLEPVPPGVRGEIYLAGECLAEGYHHRPAATAERFLPDPFVAGERMYRTGDLARRLPSGSLEFLGRSDDQVKLHGRRIEPGEVEAELARHPEVASAVVAVVGDTADRRRLVAYVVPAADAAPRVEELRRFLAERLPASMVPTAFVSVPALPTTVNGKIDRAALTATADERLMLEGEEVPPETDVERAIAAIWQRVLGRERIGLFDDFFHLGGQSILAAQVVHRIDQAFRVELPLRAMFSERTVAGLSLLVEQMLLDRLESEGRQEARHG